MSRISIHKLREHKKSGDRFAMLTAYDYPTARLVEQAGIPVILVGDSLGATVLGYESTVPVTMDEMLHHTRAVVRATSKSIVVADMPFLSYQANEDMAIENAGKFLKAGATAVKLEGGRPIIPIVHRMVEAGIPVMGHLGLTPQSINQFGGHKVQGKTPAAAARILNDAQALEDAGAFALVLETVPEQLALMVTRRLLIPTIGIGAGVNCDAQVQVLHDILGIYDDSRVFHHTKRYMNLGESIRNAVRSYADEVTQGSFPTSEHAFDMEEDVLHELTQAPG